jgi:hypothetical protein
MACEISEASLDTAYRRGSKRGVSRRRRASTSETIDWTYRMTKRKRMRQKQMQPSTTESRRNRQALVKKPRKVQLRRQAQHLRPPAADPGAGAEVSLRVQEANTPGWKEVYLPTSIDTLQ